MHSRIFPVYLVVLAAATLLAAVVTFLPWSPPLPGTGLAPVEQSLARVEVVPQRVKVLGYERAEFGSGWRPHGGCTMREAVLSAQFAADPTATPAVGCGLPDTTAADPYTGAELAAGDAEIDHIFPLSAAWDLGAHAWSPARRQAFANDPANLVAVHRAVNQQKSDQLPAHWLPPDPAAQCWYVQRLAEVAATYALALPHADQRVMRRACATGITIGPGEWG